MNIYGVSINLANSVRDESTTYRLGTRLNIIYKYLKSLKQKDQLDYIIFTEARECMNQNNTQKLTTLDIVLFFSTGLQMAYVFLGNNGANDMAFSKVILYNRAKLFLRSTKNIWCGVYHDLPCGAQFCQSILKTKFLINMPDSYDDKGQYINNLNREFNIVAIQAPMSPEGRESYFNTLMREFAFSETPFILIGDFNLIPSEITTKQEKLLYSNFANVTEDLDITFVGFPHDIDPKTGNPYVSSLDKVLINKKFEELFKNDDIKVSATDVIIDNQRISDHYTLHITYEKKLE